jgi:hypothetical protein
MQVPPLRHRSGGSGRDDNQKEVKRGTGIHSQTVCLQSLGQRPNPGKRFGAEPGGVFAPPRRELRLDLGYARSHLRRGVALPAAIERRLSSGLPTPDSFSDIGGLCAYWEDVKAEQKGCLAQLTEERLQERVDYINLHGQKYGYPLVDQMKHLVNHSTHHRGQITLQLRLLGKQPVSTDYLLYFDEQ